MKPSHEFVIQFFLLFFQGTKCRYCMSFSRVSLLFNTKGINFMASKTSCVSPDLQFLRTNRAKNIWDKKTKLVIHLQCTKIDSFFFTYNYLLTWLLKFILINMTLVVGYHFRSLYFVKIQMSHWCQQMVDRAEYLISCHKLAFLSAFSYFKI